MELRIEGGTPLEGATRVPGDKSVTHRALLLAALCEGVTEIKHPGTGDIIKNSQRPLVQDLDSQAAHGRRRLDP